MENSGAETGWEAVFESPGQSPRYVRDAAGIMERLCRAIQALQGENQELAALNAQMKKELAVKSLRWEYERHNRIDKIYNLLTAKKDLDILVEAIGGSNSGSTLKAKDLLIQSERSVQRQEVQGGWQATVAALGECLAAEHQASLRKMQDLQQQLIEINDELQLFLKQQDRLIQVTGMGNKEPRELALLTDAAGERTQKDEKKAKKEAEKTLKKERKEKKEQEKKERTEQGKEKRERKANEKREKKEKKSTQPVPSASPTPEPLLFITPPQHPSHPTLYPQLPLPSEYP